MQSEYSLFESSCILSSIISMIPVCGRRHDVTEKWKKEIQSVNCNVINIDLL